MNLQIHRVLKRHHRNERPPDTGRNPRWRTGSRNLSAALSWRRKEQRGHDANRLRVTIAQSTCSRSDSRWQRSTTTNSWSSKWIRRFKVNSAVWRQLQLRSQQYRNEPRLPHINGAGMSRRRSTSAVSCIESSESISPTFLASARYSPNRPMRSAQMCPVSQCFRLASWLDLS